MLLHFPSLILPKCCGRNSGNPGLFGALLIAVDITSRTEFLNLALVIF